MGGGVGSRGGGGGAGSGSGGGGRGGADAAAAASSAHRYMPEVSRGDIIWRRSALRTALFTSYGTDYFFLSELVRGSPAGARPRGVTVVDNYDHHRTAPGLDEGTYTPANPSVGVHFSVVLPPFFGSDACAADRTRVHHGTMHPKLWLLEFEQGGPSGNGFLRLAISSANLGRYDAKINNQVWVCDFCAPSDAAAAVRALSKQQLRQELDERGVPLAPLKGLDLATWQASLLQARGLASADFGCDLRRFLRALLQSAAPPLWAIWDGVLRRYDLIPPAGTHLILSVPGRHSVTRSVRYDAADASGLGGGLGGGSGGGSGGFGGGTADADVAAPAAPPPPPPDSVCEADLYGLRALRRHLRPLSERPAAMRPSVVEFACSSLGQLEDIMQPLLGSHPANAGGTEWRKANCNGRAPDKGAFRQGCAPGVVPRAVLVWPSLTESLPAFAHGKGLLTIGGGKNTMTGPSDAKCRELKACVAHNIVAAPHRRRTLHHVKMAAGIVLTSNGHQHGGQPYGGGGGGQPYGGGGGGGQPCYGGGGGGGGQPYYGGGGGGQP